MKVLFIDVEYEIRKYFLIYVLIIYSIFMGLYIFKDVNLMDYYMNTVDRHFYTIDKSLNKEYSEAINEKTMTKNDIYNITEEYYKIKESIDKNQQLAKYYFPGITIIAVILIAYIHVGIRSVYLRKIKKKLLRSIKLSKVFPISALIMIGFIAVLGVDTNYYLIKSIENINLIMSFILITFGIVVSVNIIDTMEHKIKSVLKMANIILILMFPNIFWFMGIWSSLFNVKIIKKEG